MYPASNIAMQLAVATDCLVQICPLSPPRRSLLWLRKLDRTRPTRAENSRYEIMQVSSNLTFSLL